MARYPYMLRSVVKGSPRLARLFADLNQADIAEKNARKRMLIEVVRQYGEEFQTIRNLRRIHRTTKWIMESLVDYVAEEGYDRCIWDAFTKMSRYYRRLR